MARMTFGEVLQEARERKGYDLSTAARRLRIRPDILRAIEGNDFSRMPPRGYARNMVNAYARLLGLNPTEITRMYLDEAYAYQVGRARSDVKPAGFDMGDAGRAKRAPRASQHDEAPLERAPRQNAFGRTLYDDRTAYGRGDDDQRSGSGAGRLYSEDRTHATRHTALPNSQYTNFYAGPKAPGGVQSKLPFVVAGIVVLVLLIVILFSVFGNKDGANDVPNVPVTGLTDTTQGEEGQGEQQPAKPAETAPTSAKVTYEVAAGKSPWLDIYEDGNLTSGATVTGPATKDFDVTKTFKIVTSSPDAVAVTVDGKKLDPKGDTSSGIYSYEVDFPAILEQWKKDHPDAAAPSADAAAGKSGSSDGGEAASNTPSGGTGGAAAPSA